MVVEAFIRKLYIWFSLASNNSAIPAKSSKNLFRLQKPSGGLSTTKFMALYPIRLDNILSVYYFYISVAASSLSLFYR